MNAAKAPASDAHDAATMRIFGPKDEEKSTEGFRVLRDDSSKKWREVDRVSPKGFTLVIGVDLRLSAA